MVRLIVLVLVVCVAACSKNDPAKTGTTGAPPASSSSATPGAPAAPAAPAVKPVAPQLPEVMARVNGEAITKADFERALQTIETRAGAAVPPDQRDRVYRGLLDQLVGYKLLLQESQTRKVTVPDADIEGRLASLRQQFPNEAAFTQKLQQQHVTLDQLKADARRDMAVAKMLENEVGSKVSVKPEEVQAFYDQNPQQFEQGERVRASHILITVPKDADAPTKAAARAKAEGLLKQIKAGKDFATLAKASSQDPGSAANGGDLGFFQKGQMVGPFNDVAFSLKPGAVSGIVETDFGFHIIKVVEKQPAHLVPLDQAKAQIQQFLEAQSREKQTAAFVTGLRKKGRIEILI